MIARRRAWLGERVGVALGGVLLLALVLRLARLDFQPLWWDEGWSVYFATTSLGKMLELTSVDIHPPLYYALLHLWIGVLGSSSAALRALSVLIGLAAVPVAYLAGRRLWGPRAGLLAALLLAIAPLHVFYSQEVRMYGLVMLLGLLAFYFALAWLPGGGDPGRGAWAGYVLAAAAALYSQYYAALLLLALNAVVLAGWWREGGSRRRLWSWLGAQAAVAALYLPWLLYAGSRLLSYVQYKVTADRDAPLGLLTYLARHLAALGWGHAEGALAGWWWLGLLPLGGLAVAGMWVVVKKGRSTLTPDPSPSEGEGRQTLEPCRSEGEGRQGWGAWACAAVVGVLLAAGYGINLVFPFNPARSERLLLPALPAVALLWTAVLRALWPRRRTVALLLSAAYAGTALLSLGFFYGTPRYPEDDYRPLVARLHALARPGDVAVAVHPWQVGYLHAYWPDADTRPRLVLSPREVLPRERQLWADDPALLAAELDALLAQQGRLWLPAHQSMGRVLEDRLEAYLATHAYPALSEWYGEHTLLSGFAQGWAGAPPVQPVAASFGGWLALDEAAAGSGPLPAGEGVVPVRLSWRLAGSPPGDAAEYRVAVRLLDAAGRVWGQRDSLPQGGLGSFANWPAAGALEDHHGLLLPAGTPPGEYQLAVQVYREAGYSVLPVAFEGGSGGQLPLGRVEVTRPAQPPPAAALDIGQPLQAELGPLRLLGYAVHESELRNGESVRVDLFWQALAAPGEDYLPRLRLVDGDGGVQAELLEKPVAGSYPTAWWQAGDLVRDPHDVPVPATAPAGVYRLELGLVRAADGPDVSAGRGRTALELGEITVRGRQHQYEPPSPQHRQATVLDEAIELSGYDLPGAAVPPGSELSVTLYWHARQTPDRAYFAFVHLLDVADQIVAQSDGVPGAGELPTLSWLPGEYLVDAHTLPLPPDLPPGEYRLAVGLYDPITQQRLGELVVLAETVAVSAKD